MESNDQLNRETQIAAFLLSYLNDRGMQEQSGDDRDTEGWKRLVEKFGVDMDALEPLIRPLMKRWKQ